jgi:hypothetical protein
MYLKACKDTKKGSMMMGETDHKPACCQQKINKLSY